MIAKLTGILDSAAEGTLVIDVAGVGYLVQASARTISRIGGRGDPVSVLIDTHVREDAITLFGFADSGEQQWFRLLYSVQGVGPKAAMAILSACPPDRIGLAIASGDESALRQAEGVGPKLAARIVTELKDKAQKMGVASSSGPAKLSSKGQNGMGQTGPSFENDAVSALVNLGYARADAYAAVMQVWPQSNDNLQELIRLALKALAS